MKQQVVVAPEKIEIQNVPIPELTEEDVLIKMMRVGICGSDIHVYYGKHPTTNYPVTQGHEVSGIIEKVGQKVSNVKPGDKVTIQPQVVCGTCYPCLNGRYHICDRLKVMGFQTIGMASEYFVTDSSKVVKLPDEMSYEEGAMIEPLAVACGALSKVEDITNKKIIILGAGPIGNLMAQTALALGAHSVLITELSEFRLTIAKKVGINHPNNPRKQDLKREIIKVFGTDKADLIIECVGSNQTINDAIANARKGTDILIVGVYGDKPTIDLNSVQDRELRLIGSSMYQTKDYIQAINLVMAKKVKLDPLMTNHFSLDNYGKAYKYIEEKKDRVMKVFIDIN